MYWKMAAILSRPQCAKQMEYIIINSLLKSHNIPNRSLMNAHKIQN